MARDQSEAIDILAKEGLRERVARYLRKYPDSVDHLTISELREQVIMHPDAWMRREHRVM